MGGAGTIPPEPPLPPTPPAPPVPPVEDALSLPQPMTSAEIEMTHASENEKDFIRRMLNGEQQRVYAGVSLRSLESRPE